MTEDKSKKTLRNKLRCRMLIFYQLYQCETRQAAVTSVLCVVASFTCCQVFDEFLLKASGMFWQFCRKGKLLHNQ